jgi:hypothetical protein
MSSSPMTSLLDVELQSGKPAILRAAATGDAPGWAAEHRDGLRAVVAEHGAVLVRGLGCAMPPRRPPFSGSWPQL